MSRGPSLASIPDDELLHRLSALIDRDRRLEADVVAHIAEVDSRRLYLGQGCSSMHAYATEVLHLSEAEAYLRITVARASRRFPLILAMLGDGRLHLSGIAKLAPKLTEENAEMLLARATHQSKREIEKLVAEVAPKPDVPERTRKLRTRASREPNGDSAKVALRPDRVAEPAQVTDPATRAPVTVIDEAVTLLLQKLEGRRFGKTSSPRKSAEESDTSGKTRHIPAAIRRLVFDRDGGRCTFVGAGGKRCSCADPGKLEYHHIHPYGRGGDHDPNGLTLRCRAHNAYQAELDYGIEALTSKRKRSGDGSSRASEPSRSCSRERMIRGASGSGGRKRAPGGPRPPEPVVLSAGWGLLGSFDEGFAPSPSAPEYQPTS